MAFYDGLVGVRLRNVVWVGEKESRDLFIRGAPNIHRAVSAVTWLIPIDLSYARRYSYSSSRNVAISQADLVLSLR